jgi:hypothetical protein
LCLSKTRTKIFIGICHGLFVFNNLKWKVVVRFAWYSWPCTLYTHYIYSVLVQDFVSGQVCCMNQYHYESRKWWVVMRLFHTTDKTWYKVSYQHTIYVISLSNFSIKTNFKQITKVELNLYNTLRETTFCAWCHVNFANVTLLCCVSHSNDMMSCVMTK